MNPKENEKIAIDSDEISVKDVLIKINTTIKYLKTKWLTFCIVGFIGGVIGLGYAKLKKPIYVANCTFVLDEGSKGGGLSQYAGLASLAGIDMGGGGNTGLFQGDNIIELYKSRLMIAMALLNKSNFDGKDELLIDRYIDFNKLRTKWSEKDHINNISFNGDPAKFNRTQDSIVNDLVETFNKKILSVSKPDKKLGIIDVQVSTGDELFSKEFTNVLVQTVNNFYIQTKTKKASQDVQTLQKQADSVRVVLNSSISGVASASDASPNANPLLVSLRVPSQKKQIDVQASSEIYSEIVKNLEVSKMMLRQETPLIQVIDAPILPLKVNKIGKSISTIIGVILASFITMSWLLIRKSLRKIYN
ncbi:lipopolysaccharide biosynthesis protein [Mucilaginibacter sp. L196]|uniref:lipopolysaccharide biosynthesis protein n=1 Tax=Mucilaginibacter sp. L196 TaxID=1641870 RepID=UPI00131D3E3D|nr:lipopolysaccharide biosynthesis protein [Mucilaginibacter sp. L196]